MDAPAAFSIFSGLCLVALIGLGWGLRCNNRTYKQREAIRNWVFEDAFHYRQRLELMNAVTYEQHFRALLWFKDPFQLYDPEIGKALVPDAPGRANLRRSRSDRGLQR
jgi:hypothetical protein